MHALRHISINADVISLRKYALNSLLFMSLMLSFASPCLAASIDFNEEELAALRGGEIQFQILHKDKPGGGARVAALFHTNSDDIWDIIGLCKYELIYVRGLELCEARETGDLTMQVHHRVHSGWYAPTLDFTFEASRTIAGRGEVKLLGGDLKVLIGSWVLLPVPDENQVIVIHEVRVQTKTPAPRWMVRRSLRKDLPNMLACMRGLARASGDADRTREDLNRCPGAVPP